MPEAAGLRAQGALSVTGRGGWRLGWLALTGTALTFTAPGGRDGLRIPLAGIAAVDADRRSFVLAAKRVIRLTYRDGRAPGPRICWLITAELGRWEAALRHRAAAAPVTDPPPAAIAAGLERLPERAAQVLDYLARRGYASTADLTALAALGSEDALYGWLREQFGPLERVLGGAAIRYLGTHFDRSSGQVRHQCWLAHRAVADGWLAARDPADVLVEEDEVVVVVNLAVPWQRAGPAVQVAADGRGLTVRGPGGSCRWIALPEPVAPPPRAHLTATGTLIVRAARRGAARAGAHGRGR